MTCPADMGAGMFSAHGVQLQGAAFTVISVLPCTLGPCNVNEVPLVSCLLSFIASPLRLSAERLHYNSLTKTERRKKPKREKVGGG